MRNVFLDFGGNEGQGLRHFVQKYNINSSWIVETFEPNPTCDIRNNIKDLSYVKINDYAVYDYNGEIEFSQMLEDSQGSSVECLMSEDACKDNNSVSFRKHDSIIKVYCKDVSDVINNYKEDLIICKMDIEGSEFRVLRKMIKDDTIRYIKDLYVEWHTKYIKGESEQSENILKTLIRSKGINLYDWH